MGTTRWSDDDYAARERLRKKTGKSAFEYTDETMKRVSRDQWKVNQKMDPKGVTRESRDSATHPESLAIAVMFDHTGSMGGIPRVVQKRLTQLFGLLLKKSYVEHPQILFGAVGDATSDQAPLQVGQFESGIEMDEDLGRLLLEGNGGTFGEESYELAIYFLARHTSIDCWEKREKKGYLFLMGDELPYPRVKSREVKGLIGDNIQDIPVEKIVAEAKKRYNVFFIIPAGASGGSNPDVLGRWWTLCGQESVIKIDDPEAISEMIALVIGITEGKITLEQGLEDLKEIGVSASKIASIARALESVPLRRSEAPKREKTAAPKTAETKKKKEPKAGRL